MADDGDGHGRSGTLQIAQYLLPCHSTALGISRMPATSSGLRPLALFLPGVTSLMNAACLRAIPLTILFDLIVCELPGHGISGEVDDVSLEGFAREYAALIDRYIPSPPRLWVIGESFGGLIAAVLVRLRPNRIGGLVLLETPFSLTRPPLAALLSRLWQQERLPYYRRIYQQVFGFDPEDGSQRDTSEFYSLLNGLPADCTILPGSEAFRLQIPIDARSPSQQTDDELTMLRTIPRVTVLPRIASAGHCLLLDDPQACVAALSRHLGM